MPCKKFVVPSKGSTTQRHVQLSPPDAPLSSMRKGVSGTRLREFLAYGGFGAQVCLADEVGRPFDADLQLLDFVKIPQQPLGGFLRSVLHDGHMRRKA